MIIVITMILVDNTDYANRTNDNGDHYYMVLMIRPHTRTNFFLLKTEITFFW